MRAALIFFLAGLMACAGLASSVRAQDIPVWEIMPESSSISFKGTQMGAEFTGTFGAFGGVIAFDPENLSASRVDIAVDIASAVTGSADRDKYITAAQWFDTAVFPQARLVSREITANAAVGSYMLVADLTVRDVTRSVEIPFMLVLEESKEDGPRTARTARAEGAFDVQRLDFGVGQGEWKDTSMVGNDIAVIFEIYATQKAAGAAADSVPDSIVDHPSRAHPARE